MPAKALTKDQLADAHRLKAQFKAWQGGQKALGRVCSQEEVAHELGFGQSALSQYLNGHIPLNPEALMKFCTLMGVQPQVVSPSIVEAEAQRAKRYQGWFPTPRVGQSSVMVPLSGGMKKTSEQKVRARQLKRG